MREGMIDPRYLRPRIVEALSDSPVVPIHGQRPCGKTTLVRLVGDSLAGRLAILRPHPLSQAEPGGKAPASRPRHAHFTVMGGRLMAMARTEGSGNDLKPKECLDAVLCYPAARRPVVF
jgi:hypothetical protein